MRPKTLQKVTTNHGSRQQKIVEDGRYLQATTQWLQKKDLKIIRDTEEILKADQQDTSTEWDWVMMKWPTSHNTKWKKRSKIKNEATLESSTLRTPHVARLQAQATVREKKYSRTSWWIDDQELRDWLTEKKTTWGKNTSAKHLRLDTTQAWPKRSRIIRVTDPVSKEDGNYSGRTDELWCLPHFSTCCLPGFPGTLSCLFHRIWGFYRCSNSDNLSQQQPVL